MTISSSDALPARSPTPFTVHSIWRQPASIAARLFATARPRSLWQCAEKTTRSAPGRARANRREELVDLVRRRVADGVREVHGRRAGLDHRGHDRAEVVEVAPRRVLGRELHVVDVPPRAGDRAGRGLESLAARHVELVREVEVRRGDERVEARPGAAVERLERAVHVRVHGARERGDHGTADGLRDGADAREVVFRGDREPGLEDVHAQLVELHGEAHLLRLAHREAGRLLAVPERRVEDRDARPNVALRVHVRPPSR